MEWAQRKVEGGTRHLSIELVLGLRRGVKRSASINDEAAEMRDGSGFWLIYHWAVRHISSIGRSSSENAHLIKRKFLAFKFHVVAAKFFSPASTIAQFAELCFVCLRAWLRFQQMVQAATFLGLHLWVLKVWVDDDREYPPEKGQDGSSSTMSGQSTGSLQPMYFL